MEPLGGVSIEPVLLLDAVRRSLRKGRAVGGRWRWNRVLGGEWGGVGDGDVGAW